MAATQYLLIVCLPLLGGMVLAMSYARCCRKYNKANIVGLGLLFGMLLATLILRLQSGLQLSFQPGFFLLFGLLALVAAIVLLRACPSRELSSVVPMHGHSFAQNLLILVCLLLLAVRLALLAEEALARPLSGWDVTMHWATKAKVWLDNGALVPFVSNDSWLISESGVFTDHHPNYPGTIPLLQVWMGVALGGWSETAVNLPWVLTGLALLLLFFGGAVLAGASPATAAVFTYLLGSLPLLNSHIAFAGYADLLLGTCYLAALQALLLWSGNRNTPPLILASLLAVTAMAIKNEGFFWSSTLLAGVMATLIPIRRLLILLAVGAAVLALFLVVLPGDFTLAGHSLTRLELGLRWHALPALFQQLFVLGSWHLAGVMLLAALLIGLRYPAALKGLGVLAIPLLVALAMYLFLFTATRFSYGAIHGTSANRIALHLMPSLFFLMTLVMSRLWEQTGLDLGELESAPQID